MISVEDEVNSGNQNVPLDSSDIPRYAIITKEDEKVSEVGCCAINSSPKGDVNVMDVPRMIGALPEASALVIRTEDEDHTTSSISVLRILPEEPTNSLFTDMVALDMDLPKKDQINCMDSIQDPIEGRDSEFDVELSSGSSVHSMSLTSTEFDDDLGDASKRDGTTDIVASQLSPGSFLNNGNGRNTVYGSVVKSIKKSLKRFLHYGKPTAPSIEATSGADVDGLSGFQSGFANTASLSCESSTDIISDQILSNNHWTPVNKSSSPITSVPLGTSAPGLIPLPAVHKTLRIDVAYTKPLLGVQRERDYGKKCLVLDLDETLVHSTFQPVDGADLIVPVHFGDGMYQPIYVCKRPGVDVFLRAYADPVIDYLDPEGTISYRLYRDSCLQFQGVYIKDLSRLGRNIDEVLIIDNSPASYSMQPQNALGCRSWFTDPLDRELLDRIWPLLKSLATSTTVGKWRMLNIDAIERPYYN